MTRRRRQGIGFGILGLVLLLAVGGYFAVSHVENTLTSDTESWLAAQGQSDLKVDAKGREIVLTGTANPGTDIVALRDDLKSNLPHQHDHWWSFNDDPGVRLVDTKGVTVPAAEEPEPEPQEQAPVEVIPTGIVDTEIEVQGDQVTLSGTVLSEEQRAALVSAAEAEFGAENVTDNLEVAGLAPQIEGADARVAALAGLLPTLHNRMNGLATLNAEELTITGVGLDAAAPSDIDAAAATAANTGLQASVNVAPPAEVGFDDAEEEAVPEEAVEAVEDLDVTGVQFDYDTATLTPEAQMILDDVALELNEYPDVTVQVSGYTDSRGNPAANLVLSQQRAESVVAYLVDSGVDANRLVAKGFGVENPIASNETDEGRAQNRRVELAVIEGN